MALLENQSILLIAPQPWDHLHISKHHYAIELARRGNTVYYLEPPNAALASSVQIDRLEDYPGVFVVRYRPAFPFVVRFHARWLFDRLMKRQIRRIKREIHHPIDVVWSFEFNLFADLREFGAPLVVFHVVDPVSEAYQVKVARSATAVFSVSEDILANFRHLGVPTWFINHGVAPPFAEIARQNLGKKGTNHGVSRVGYAGNLARPPVNRRVLRQMIEQNPSIEFHFWGPRDVSESHTSDVSGEIRQFIEFLDRSPNVQLHGSVPVQELAKQLPSMDCLVLSYSLDPRDSDRSNSHKILEYLSTGKVVVSSRISTYVAHTDLLCMPANGDDSLLPALLHEALARLDEFNALELQDRRRRLALDNTYERQLDRIEAKLSTLIPL